MVALYFEPITVEEVMVIRTRGAAQAPKLKAIYVRKNSIEVLLVRVSMAVAISRTRHLLR